MAKQHKPVSKWHSPQYFAERKPVHDKFLEQCDSVWKRRLAGELTPAEHLQQIEPFFKQYVKELTPVWKKHGGPK